MANRVRWSPIYLSTWHLPTLEPLGTIRPGESAPTIPYRRDLGFSRVGGVKSAVGFLNAGPLHPAAQTRQACAGPQSSSGLDAPRDHGWLRSQPDVGRPPSTRTEESEVMTHCRRGNHLRGSTTPEPTLVTTAVLQPLWVPRRDGCERALAVGPHLRAACDLGIPNPVGGAPPSVAELGGAPLGGSAFDACVEYELPSESRGFIGIETKYHEDLAWGPELVPPEGSPARAKYARETQLRAWRAGAAWELTCAPEEPPVLVQPADGAANATTSSRMRLACDGTQSSPK